MIAALVNYVSDTSKTLVTSVGAVVASQVIEPSTLSKINTGFQHFAWSIAILAGLFTIVNLFFPLRTFYENSKRRKHEQFIRENEND